MMIGMRLDWRRVRQTSMPDFPASLEIQQYKAGVLTLRFFQRLYAIVCGRVSKAFALQINPQCFVNNPLIITYEDVRRFCMFITPDISLI